MDQRNAKEVQVFVPHLLPDLKLLIIRNSRITDPELV